MATILKSGNLEFTEDPGKIDNSNFGFFKILFDD
jgi:hypothetical protein